MKPIVAIPVILFAAAVAAGETPALTLVVTADKPAYRHPAAGKPAVAAVALKVKNESASEAILDFSTGQRYDFVLYDKGGQAVARWSAERMFTMALGQMRLAAGETKKFSDSLALAADGKGLPAGDYELEGVLASSPPHASKRIKLKIAP
ncbi:MAG: hypothetical protein HZA91_03815 [Verrucomicrobia bacterium]|nr:hypothetical protein [Verrucomicrobiota bacterium]